MEMNTRITEQAYLNNYSIRDYDTPLTTVDIVIFTVLEGELKVLLVKRADHPFKDTWALPGGFISLEEDRSLEETALRKLKEKTGVKSPYLEQLKTIGNHIRDPRGWSVTVIYFALVAADSVTLSKGQNISDIEWRPIDSASCNSDLAFDHNEILNSAIARLKNKVEYTALPLHLLPPEFTLTEFQQIFEIILGHTVDKSAFRRRINQANLIEEIPDKMRLGSNRPAKLYKPKSLDSVHHFSRTIERKDI